MKSNIYKSKEGWFIIHPKGTPLRPRGKSWIELDYFYQTNWSSHGLKLTREQWRKKYRPDCKMVRGTITFQDES